MRHVRFLNLVIGAILVFLLSGCSSSVSSKKPAGGGDCVATCVNSGRETDQCIKACGLGAPLQNKKCGDGVCDNAESANLTLCPGDCSGQEIATTTQPASSKNSNGSSFGFHYGGDMHDTMDDLGADWTREGMYVVWEWSDAGRNGSYRFTDAVAPSKNGKGADVTINYDTQWLKIPDDFNLVVNVNPFRRGGNFKDDAELAVYKDFVEKMTERYDGDDDYGCSYPSVDCYKKGDGQYPSQEVISYFKKNPIKYWQVCNQVWDVCTESDCRTTYASKYAEVMKASYEAVKSADSSSYVIIAGDSSKREYPAVFKELNGKYVDIIDFHRFGEAGWYDPQSDFDYLKESLESSNFDLSKLKFWITETGTYAGNPNNTKGMVDLSSQTEKQQAEGAVKAYVSGLGYGIEKMFWAWGIQEGFQRDCSIFDYTGIIYDGCDCVNGKYACDQNGIGDDPGRGVKKLAYYSYKKMTETLDGWSNVETVQKSDGIYIYKFTKNGKNVWVVWNDDSGEKTITISGIASSQVSITEALPKYGTGKEVTDYSSAFNVRTEKQSGGKVSIAVGDAPLFIEEK